MERIEQEASARKAVAVHRVRVRIGELSGVEPELFASAFDLVREQTMCAHATLDITRIPARWECQACATTIALGEPLQCARCGASARLAAGDDIVLEQIEMEVP
jgi:hydrogenase nickel incorporation protein HypA/HybF